MRRDYIGGVGEIIDIKDNVKDNIKNINNNNSMIKNTNPQRLQRYGSVKVVGNNKRTIY